MLLDDYFRGEIKRSQKGWRNIVATAAKKGIPVPAFSTALALQASDRKQIEELRSWAADHLAEDLRVENLAAQAAMSPRNFARVFLKSTGITPARFVERIRVEAARRRLEECDDSIEKIASDCGLGSVQALRRTFRRVLKVAPGEYRKRFSDAA